MGVVNKLKRLHKQDMLKPHDIKRVVVADEAGVNNNKYLHRARTLKSLTSGDEMPTVSSDLDTNVATGVPIEYNSTTTAGDFEDTPVFSIITIDRFSDVKYEYFEENQEEPGFIEFPEKDGTYIFGIEGNGYPLRNYTSKFRITFNADGEYHIHTELVNDYTKEVLATSDKTITATSGAQKASAKKSKSFKM